LHLSASVLSQWVKISGFLIGPHRLFFECIMPLGSGQRGWTRPAGSWQLVSLRLQWKSDSQSGSVPLWKSKENCRENIRNPSSGP